MDIFKTLKENIHGKQIRIVFPEATDARILKAAVRLYEEDLIEPVLLGNLEEVETLATEEKVSLEGIEVISPHDYDDFDEMVAEFVEIRKGKATEEDARQILKETNYFGTMLVKQGIADGLVGGAVYTTGDTVRPALQIVKTRPGTKLISSSFLMIRDDERYIFADSAINIDPDAETLAEIAIESAQTAKVFGIDPKVAMLSFSTLGSGAGEMVDKVREATKIAKDNAPDLAIDGEFQFDAAFDATVASQKAPDSEVAGQANVFVFPNLESGNIGYKIAQRMGNFEAIGPILQGLARPISDLSRGANEEDVYKTTIITANQVLNQ